MSNEKDNTPLADDLGAIAANEGVETQPADPQPESGKKKPGRPRGPNYRDRAAEKARAEARKNGQPVPPRAKPASQPAPDPDFDAPFSPQELKDTMGGIAGMAFAIPGEIMAQRRPDLAEHLKLDGPTAEKGGKALVWYLAKRFPLLMEKWGPEVMLGGMVVMAYGPRILIMVQNPPTEETKATIDGKPAPIHAVP